MVIDMENPILYRKRIIPDECIRLKDDIILSCHDDHIVTAWNALKPKKDLHHGYSCYFLNEGIKVSKFFQRDDSLICWYCDIVEYDYNRESNSLVTTDLLVDVIVYPDGLVKVVDLDELAIALEAKSITADRLGKSLLIVNKLLQIIYNGEFSSLQQYINEVSH
ncbi:MAG: DUF402 domain-containing protein [Lachnospiraceae bacterium]|jgi:predicted RNA-binding protein associated with RNAse of E/G family|nr:DUF402 domain-containing protein [Lachnospiraceae bacterium]